MSNHDSRNEVERIDDLITDGKAMPLPVSMPYGFPVAMEVHEVQRRVGRKPHYRFRIIAPNEGQDVEIYVSPTGRSVRVYRGGEELTSGSRLRGCLPSGSPLAIDYEDD
jgi:hypothetical protein